MKQDKLKLLLIGPLPPPIGGTTILFQQLIADLRKKRDINVSLINTSTNQFNTSTKGEILIKKIPTALRILKETFCKIKRVDLISFYVSMRGLLFLTPLLCVISKLYKKPMILIKSAGSLDLTYQKSIGFQKFLLTKSLSSVDVCLFETKHLTNFFRQIKCNTKWFPNNRPNQNFLRRTHQCKKFVYIGHVYAGKGINEIIAAGKILEKQDITIDVYGPLRKGFSKKKFAKSKNISYHGPVPHSEVIPLLQKYHVLLLPTCCTTEGYTGIILEAYSTGMPVIATKLGGIPEIVDSSSGILVGPRNVEQLKEAMLKIHKDSRLFQRLQRGASEKAKIFDSKKWSQKFIDICKEIINQK